MTNHIKSTRGGSQLKNSPSNFYSAKKKKKYYLNPSKLAMKHAKRLSSKTTNYALIDQELHDLSPSKSYLQSLKHQHGTSILSNSQWKPQSQSFHRHPSHDSSNSIKTSEQPVNSVQFSNKQRKSRSINREFFSSLPEWVTIFRQLKGEGYKILIWHPPTDYNFEWKIKIVSYGQAIKTEKK